MRILIQSGALVCWNLGLVYGSSLGKIRGKRFTLKSHPRKLSYQVAFGSTVRLPEKSLVPATKKNFKKTFGKKKVVLLLDEELRKKCEADNDDGGFQEFICPSMEKLQKFITENVDLFKSSANEIESIRDFLKNIEFEKLLDYGQIYPDQSSQVIEVYETNPARQAQELPISEHSEKSPERKEDTHWVWKFFDAFQAVANSFSTEPKTKRDTKQVHRIMAGLALLTLYDKKENACQTAQTRFSYLNDPNGKCGEISPLLKKINDLPDQTLCPGLIIRLDFLSSSCSESESTQALNDINAFLDEAAGDAKKSDINALLDEAAGDAKESELIINQDLITDTILKSLGPV